MPLPHTAHTMSPYLLVLAAALAGACATPQTEIPGDGESRESVRGYRTCELFELTIFDDALGIDVWNSGTFHECPDDYLAAIDREQFAVGGPRWRSVDELVTIGPDGEPLEVEPEISEVPAGLGYDMFFAAQVGLVPLTQLEAQLGVSVTTLTDVPESLRAQILASTVAGRGYDPVEVHRTYGTHMVHHAGNPVYVLDDGNCRYAMKFYTNVVEPSLTNEDAVAALGELLELPEGYSFSVEVFEEDLVIDVPDGVTVVVSDELGNSYDRFACG